MPGCALSGVDARAGGLTLLQLKPLLADLPPIEALFHARDRGALDETGMLACLAQREVLLGDATLSAKSLKLLYDLTRALFPPESTSVNWHAATFSAAETQRVLPQGVTVLKTVTVQLGGDLNGGQHLHGQAGKVLLWSSLGDTRIEHRHLRFVGRSLGLSAAEAKRSYINPAHIDPSMEFGMRAGMVSPLLPPERTARLDAVVVIWSEDDASAGSPVALSLSPFESLILHVPLSDARALLHEYMSQAYPPGFHRKILRPGLEV